MISWCFFIFVEIERLLFVVVVRRRQCLWFVFEFDVVYVWYACRFYELFRRL